MSRDYIEFISAYCDRWCERCAFTSRCSAYAVEVATAMCDGDFAAGLELAVGRAARPGEPQQPGLDVPDENPSEAEIERVAREEDARDARVDESPITTMATMALTLAHRWLEEHRAHVSSGDPALRDAVDVAAWDAHLVPAKLHRALHVRDAARRGESFSDDHPIQNDWNGSAKVALVSIERSHAAWQLLSRATSDPDAVQVADLLARLRDAVDAEFPDARRFVRPGFDDGTRRRWWRRR